MIRKLLVVAFIPGLLTSCGPKRLVSVGDQTIHVFTNEHVYFDPALNEGNLQIAKDSTVRLNAGRILIKKIALPVYEKHVDVKVEVILTSAGDPWDKAGSCFVIPSESDINFINIQKGDKNWVQVPDRNDSFPGIVAAEGKRRCHCLDIAGRILPVAKVRHLGI